MHDHNPHDSIEIIVITTAQDLNASFNEHEPMEVVFRRALALVGGEGKADQFNLDYNDQPLTDLHRPISDFAAELGWGKGVELELVPKPVVV